MFKDSNFDKIAEETNHYVRQVMDTKPDPARDQIYICGTIHKNRQGIPRAIAPSTQSQATSLRRVVIPSQR